MLGKLLFQKCKLSFFVQYMLQFLSQNKFCTKEKKTHVIIMPSMFTVVSWLPVPLV